MIKLVIVDDHKIVREGIAMLIEFNPGSGIEVVGEAASGKEALSVIREKRPDIALIDIGMPDMSGLEMVNILRSSGDETKVIILSTHHDPININISMKLGVNGYIVKNDSIDDIIEAIHAVASDKKYMSRSIDNDCLVWNVFGRLTRREYEVFELIFKGLSTREIAEKLDTSIKTVGMHRTRLMEKLDLHSVVELVKYGYKIGLKG